MNFGICATPSRPNSKSALNPRDSIVFCKLRRISLQGLVRSAHFLQPGGFGFLFPLLRFDRQQHDDADDEEEGEGEDPKPAGAGELPHQPEDKGAEDGGKLSGQAEEPEKFRIAVNGNQAAEDGAAQGLTPPLHGADQDRQGVEVEGCLHEIAQNHDCQVDDQGGDQGAHGTDPVSDPAEEKGAGDPDKLGDQQGGDQVGLSDADLPAVYGGHLDDGVDSVGEKPEGDQKLQQFGIPFQPADRIPGGTDPGRGEGGGAELRLGQGFPVPHMAEKGDGEDKPPEAHRQEGKLGGHEGIRQKKSFRKLNGSQIEGEQEPASDVAVGIPPGGDPVPLLLRDQVRQKGIIKDIPPGEGQGAQENEQGGPQPVPLADEDEEDGGEDTHIGEKTEEGPLGMGSIGDGSQHRR